MKNETKNASPLKCIWNENVSLFLFAMCNKRLEPNKSNKFNLKKKNEPRLPAHVQNTPIQAWNGTF